MIGRCAVVALALAAGTQVCSAAQFDLVNIGVSLDFAGGAQGPNGEQPFRRLRGQSAYLSFRTNSGTSGGQLDGVSSMDSAQAVHNINFVEVFPEQNLSDYLRFAYFGVVETFGYDEGTGDEILVDRSFVIAGRNLPIETRVQDLFPTLTEDTLVAALTGSFDSPEFFTVMNAIPNNPLLSGALSLFESDGMTGMQVRQGDSLTLYAFLFDDDFDNGHVARDIGFIDSSVFRVIPAPSSAALIGVGLLSMSRRRRG